MVNISGFADALKAAARASAKSSKQDRQSYEELFSQSLRDALNRVNNGVVDSYDFGPWVVSNLILLADVEGYELSETISFLQAILE